MIDEPIHLEKYDSSWRQWFIQEQERIRRSLQVDFDAIQHIGSTAIPGIYAKPIIDILVGVEELPPPQLLSNRLTDLGYEAMGEAGVPGRLYFRYRGLRSFNVHLVERQGYQWKSNLAFRDYLQTYPEAAKQYEAVKLQAVRSGAASLLQYSEAKLAIVQKLLSEAIAWQKGTRKQ